jgi:hypothetical protein
MDIDEEEKKSLLRDDCFSTVDGQLAQKSMIFFLIANALEIERKVDLMIYFIKKRQSK